MCTAVPVPILERDPELPGLTLEGPFLLDDPSDSSTGHARSLFEYQANRKAFSDGEGSICRHKGPTKTDIDHPDGRRDR